MYRLVKRLTVMAVLAIAGFGSIVHADPDVTSLAELDDFWAEVSRSVAAGDFDAYAATYHADGVLVHLGSTSSVPISIALSNWKPGFTKTKAGEQKVGVSFRFTQRLVSATTAHETGIFLFWSQPAQGELSESFIHFEALSVKKDGEWNMLMEYQKERATKIEWDAIGDSN